MSDYLKTVVKITHSENSDYSDPESVTNWDDMTETPDEVWTHKIEASTSAGTTLTTSVLASSTLLAVKNTDSTNFVTATISTAGTATVAVKISAGDVFVTPDYLTSGNLLLVADSAAVICKIVIAGS